MNSFLVGYEVTGVKDCSRIEITPDFSGFWYEEKYRLFQIRGSIIIVI